jgi:hypothetical protein
MGMYLNAILVGVYTAIVGFGWYLRFDGGCSATVEKQILETLGAIGFWVMWYKIYFVWLV